MGDAIKMKLETKDMAAENVQKIANLFPNCVTEKEKADGRLEKAINWKMLKQMLKGKVIDGEEAYEFTWVGKKAAIVEANKPIRKTLRPCKEESKNWDTTENLYIEGDNLEALKLLQESYLSNVKMIYIDPPYNKGKDRIYKDNFTQTFTEYEDESGIRDEHGNIMEENHSGDARFHSKWCSMLYSRLLLARNLLDKDGLIFVSIDDDEFVNMKKILDDVFEDALFINCFIWQKNSSVKTDRKKFTVNTEYVFLYANSSDYKLNDAYKPLAEASQKLYNKDDNDGRGRYQTVSLQKPRDPGPDTTYDYIDNNGKIWKCPPKGWRMVKDKIKALENDNRLVLTGNTLRVKDYWNERDNEGKRIDSLWNDISQNTAGSSELESTFNQADIFSNPKPIELISRCLKIADKDAVVLDFFSGSATTAHAVMQLNVEDGGHRKFIMVQIPEPTDKNSEAYKAGYKNICEIGKERIRRAGDKIVADNADKEGMADLDIGFRVLKVDSSNMNDVYYGAEDYSQHLLLQMEDNIKSDRTELDLLFGCIVDWGLELSCPYASTEIEGYTVHNYNDGDLVACFAENIPESVIKAIAKMEPMRAVFRDSGFADSPAKINVTEIFKRLSPDTDVRVI